MDAALQQVIDALSWGFLTAGGLFCMAGGIGLVRLPELFTRMHAAGVIDTGGAALILIGLMLQSGLTLVTVKLLFILFFLLLTGPTATHALAKAALAGRVRPVTRTTKKDAGPS